MQIPKLYSNVTYIRICYQLSISFSMTLAEEKFNAITGEEWRNICLRAIEEEKNPSGRN